MKNYEEHIRKLEEELLKARSGSDKNRISYILDQLLSG